MQKHRVVVTGLGVVSPLGVGTEKFWQNLIAGESGISRFTHFDSAAYDCQIAGMVPDFDPLKYFDSKEARHLSNFIQFALVASREAVAQAKLNFQAVNLDRVAVLVGSGIGSLQTMEEEFEKLRTRGPSRMSPFFIPKMIINEAAGHIAIETGARGPASCVTTACATATNAIGDAARLIEWGIADVVIAGGTESAVTPLGIGGFCALKALSRRNAEPKKASRPFDLHRDGFVMGEGAGIVVLESLKHAQSRGAKILAEFAGYGSTCDAHHITAPEPSGKGAARAMLQTVEDAGMKLADVSYINAHGTSTELNDKGETLAIKAAFGDLAKKIPVSSTKSMTGHLLGAAGGIEFAAIVLAIRDDIIPPTINYETPDPDCDLDYVPNQARKVTVNFAISNSLGFGGHNATIGVKKYI
ncbi:MAG: beta-ketoacyl-ACP synthase II [Candidatus Omnitrophica bacterium]|nr:beta-ketoacyl-ACP synthase II [Candidatus Omnitrophota bacterium]